MDRQEVLERLAKEKFDLLVVGGGSTGAGIALEAAVRGLKVALVERSDFASGTSSRSTKIFHGGVRYLEQAVKKLDRSQLKLVKSALRERGLLLDLAPHLAHPLPLLIPLYHSWEIPYYFLGMKLYDGLAGRFNLKPSRYLTASQALVHCPTLQRNGLRGAILYYEGQFDDARWNVALALTAAAHGACVANYAEVVALLKDHQRISVFYRNARDSLMVLEQGDYLSVVGYAGSVRGGGQGQRDVPAGVVELSFVVKDRPPQPISL